MNLLLFIIMSIQSIDADFIYALDEVNLDL